MTAPRQSGRPAPEALDEALRANPTLNAASIDGTVLAPIVAHAFRRLEDLPEATEAAVRAALERRGGARAGTFFAGALRAPGRRVILEVKAASPSRGLMRSEIDLADYARTLNRFADAVSVLTEPKFFGGCFERLAALRPLVAKPLLAKDFFIDERQALAAAEAGADAILLMLSVLSDAGYRRLAAFADRLGLEVLTEASTPDELERARALGARVIGVNNRNLRTLEVDLSRAPALAAGLPLGPDAPVVVAESGYRTAADMEAACAKAPAIAAFLCGSALSLSKDLSTGVRELLHGRSKVCGITRAGDALAAAEAGATSVGVILAERSRRCVAPDEAAGLVSAIRGKCAGANLPVELCAVADAEELERPALLETLRSVAPDVLQIHGAADAFTPEFLSRIAKRLPGVKLAPALRLTPKRSPAGSARFSRSASSTARSWTTPPRAPPPEERAGASTPRFSRPSGTSLASSSPGASPRRTPARPSAAASSRARASSGSTSTRASRFVRASRTPPASARPSPRSGVSRPPPEHHRTFLAFRRLFSREPEP